jgi:ketol-acid reductoisomerase
LSATPKLAQPWQAYLNKYRDLKLKPMIKNAWHDYLKDIPEGEQPKKMLFEVRNKLAQKLYEEETDEVKQEVEEHRLKMRDVCTPDVDDQNKAFQRYCIISDIVAVTHIVHKKVD